MGRNEKATGLPKTYSSQVPFTEERREKKMSRSGRRGGSNVGLGIRARGECQGQVVRKNAILPGILMYAYHSRGGWHADFEKTRVGGCQKGGDDMKRPDLVSKFERTD